MSILALGALGASGCDDDKTDSDTDAGGGGSDANGGNNANNNGDDGGANDTDSAEPMDGISCGDEFCTKTKGGLLAQCCAGEGEDVCGLDLTAPGQPSLGCFPENAPGELSPGCLTALNALTGGTNTEAFEIDAGGMAITFPTCCTATGICGVQSSMTSLGDLGLGCIAATVLAPPMMSGGDAGAAADAGAAPPTSEPNGLPIIPNVFCDATTGAAATCIPAEVPGQDGTPTKVPPFLLGACAAEVDTTNNCIKNVERIIKGCGATNTWNRASLATLCIDNVAETIYGCDDVTPQTTGGLPEFLCGCGEGEIAGPRDVCISNVAETICGGTPVTAKPTCPGGGLLCNLPSVLCGCGDGLTALADAPAGTPCLKNIPLDVCGGTAVCTGLNPQGPDSCVGPDSCADVAPFTAEVKDGVGDACGCNPSVDIDPDPVDQTLRDSCDLAQTGFFDCVQVAPGQNRCSCGMVGQQGTCPTGNICTDTNTPADMIGDTCTCGTIGMQGSCAAGKICTDSNADAVGDTCSDPAPT